jgi:hypothetical protein
MTGHTETIVRIVAVSDVIVNWQPKKPKANAGARAAQGAAAKGKPSRKATAAKTAATKGKKRKASTAKTPVAPRAGSKMAQVITLLQRKGGVSIGELMKSMGWQRHTVRGFMAGAMKKAGFAVESFKPDGGESRMNASVRNADGAPAFSDGKRQAIKRCSACTPVP